MKISLYFLFSTLLFSCALKPKQEIPYTVVSIENQKQSVDKVSISTEVKDESSSDSGELEEEDQKYTLVFGPGMYLTGGYLPVIRQLEDHRENFLSVTGHGLGSYFAAMFAFNFKSDFIEWSFYKFLEETKNMQVLSKQWKKAFEEILLKDLKGKQIENAQTNLILPVYARDKKKVEWIESGDVVETVLANIEFAPHRQKNSAAFPWEFFSPFFFRNKGESKFVAILAFHSAPKFKRPDGFLNGVYTKAVSNFLRSEDVFSKVFKLPLEQYQIDSPLKSISENRELIEYAEDLTSQLDNKEDDTDE